MPRAHDPLRRDFYIQHLYASTQQGLGITAATIVSCDRQPSRVLMYSHTIQQLSNTRIELAWNETGQ